MAAVFLHQQSGKSLPKLTDPAAEVDILSPKQVIGQDGKILTGTGYSAVVLTQAEYNALPLKNPNTYYLIF